MRLQCRGGEAASSVRTVVPLQRFSRRTLGKRSMEDPPALRVFCALRFACRTHLGPMAKLAAVQAGCGLWAVCSVVIEPAAVAAADHRAVPCPRLFNPRAGRVRLDGMSSGSGSRVGRGLRCKGCGPKGRRASSRWQVPCAPPPHASCFTGTLSDRVPVYPTAYRERGIVELWVWCTRGWGRSCDV